jgi:hypothetical protein
MKFRIVPLLLLCGLLLQAQADMSVEELANMVRSEIALKQQTDKQIAAYLKKIHLTEQLPAKTIEDLEAQGAGPKTVEALKALRQQSLQLKGPAKDSTYSPETAPDQPVQQKAPHVTNSSPIPAPDSVKQAQILDATRNYARSYTASLPNFVCVEVMRRFAQFRNNDDYRSVGNVLARLSYNQGREDYKVYSVDNKFVDTTLERIAGPYSRGDFGTILHQLFADEGQAEYNWDHWATLRGRRMAVFNYSMDSAHSGLTISDEIRTVHAGSKGLFYVDAETGTIYRITQTAFDIPADFSVRAANERLDYDEADISGQKFLVPMSARVLMTSDRGKLKLDIEFRSYRKFGTEETITYGDIKDAEKSGPLPASQTEEQPAKPAQAPKSEDTSNPFGLPTPPPPPPK